jgi:hypothetical protein
MGKRKLPLPLMKFPDFIIPHSQYHQKRERQVGPDILHEFVPANSRFTKIMRATKQKTQKLRGRDLTTSFYNDNPPYYIIIFYHLSIFICFWKVVRLYR